MILAVIVALAPPVTVAALVNGNDIVYVCDACDDRGSMSFVNMATMRSSKSTPRSYHSFSISSSSFMTSIAATVAGCVLFHGRDHGHGIVPVHERGHGHGGGHVHGHGKLFTSGGLSVGSKDHVNVNGPVSDNYGRRRLSMRGKGMVSRTCSSPHSQATVRSMPSPKPACGKLP